MKLKTLLPLAFGAAVGYVLGSAAGRGRYEQIKQRAVNLVTHPKVQQTVFDVAGDVKDNASNLPGPVADLVDNAASRLQETLTTPDDANSSPTPSSTTQPSTTEPDLADSILPEPILAEPVLTEPVLAEPIPAEPFPTSPSQTKPSGSDLG